MRITSLTLETITESATGAVEFAFVPKRPLSFRAGQAGLIITAGSGAKPFTFASGDRSGRISIATTLHSGSRFKRALADLVPGGRVLAAGPIGTLSAVESSESGYSSRKAVDRASGVLTSESVREITIIGAPTVHVGSSAPRPQPDLNGQGPKGL